MSSGNPIYPVINDEGVLCKEDLTGIMILHVENLHKTEISHLNFLLRRAYKSEKISRKILIKNVSSPLKGISSEIVTLHARKIQEANQQFIRKQNEQIQKLASLNASLREAQTNFKSEIRFLKTSLASADAAEQKNKIVIDELRNKLSTTISRSSEGYEKLRIHNQYLQANLDSKKLIISNLRQELHDSKSIMNTAANNKKESLRKKEPSINAKPQPFPKVVGRPTAILSDSSCSNSVKVVENNNSVVVDKYPLIRSLHISARRMIIHLCIISSSYKSHNCDFDIELAIEEHLHDNESKVTWRTYRTIIEDTFNQISSKGQILHYSTARLNP